MQAVVVTVAVPVTVRERGDVSWLSVAWLSDPVKMKSTQLEVIYFCF